MHNNTDLHSSVYRVIIVAAFGIGQDYKSFKSLPVRIWFKKSRLNIYSGIVHAINRKKRTRDPDKQCEGNPKTHNCESYICPDSQKEDSVS